MEETPEEFMSGKRKSTILEGQEHHRKTNRRIGA
jgi:hypothetical protein